MSLLGNRGRFSTDNDNLFKNKNAEYKSVLSLIGKNPKELFNISTGSDEIHDSIREKLEKVNLDKYSHGEISSHEEFNNRINKFNRKIENEIIPKKSENIKFSNYRVSPKLIIAMFIVEAITLFGIFTVGSVYRFSNLTQSVPFDIKKVENTDITESTLEIMKGYKTVAIFGVDSRTGSVDKGNNADVNLIVNLNLENGDVQLISVYRDLYLSVTDNNSYDKLNAAYRKGGPEQAVKSLNKNLDLNIDSYFAFNWKAVADGIELLGGIDLEISKSEYKYMNAFIHETCIATGIDAKNPAGHYIKSSGMQHLDGVQAVAYGRLRLMDSDFQRVERQKKVIALCLEKAKKIDIPKLRLITEAVLPQIAYSFDMNEFVSLLRIVRTINIVESAGCPDVNNLVLMEMGGSGDCVVPLNLEKAVVKLHKILFNVDDYVPSTAVKRYSNRITELRSKYAEENRTKESIKQSSIEESILEITNNKSGSSNKNKKVASSSTSDKNVKATAPNDLPIIDTDVEEPEEDESESANNSTSSNESSNRESTNRPNNNAPVERAPGSEPAVQQAPGSNDYQEYVAPGVPSNSTNNVNRNNSINSNNNVSNNAPGSNGGSSNQGVVINGPPTGNEAPGNAPTITETTVVVPILGAPY